MWRPAARLCPRCSGLGETGPESAPGSGSADGEKWTDSGDKQEVGSAGLGSTFHLGKVGQEGNKNYVPSLKCMYRALSMGRGLC